MIMEKIKSNQEIKLFKLKKMRLIATGLLIIMTLIYFIFKRIEANNMLFSFVTAFAEAAMIGALADWFAVVALFRYPFGMKWIPHTAIIQKNRDKIGESLAEFVVSNFFTENVIKSKLNNIHFSKDILQYFKNNKSFLAEKLLTNLPLVAGAFVNNSKVSEVIHTELKSRFKKLELYPLIDSLLPVFISSELHIPIICKLLDNVYQWVNNNKEKTIKIIEGLNKKFSFPFVGDIIYGFIVKTLMNITEDIQKGTLTEFNKEILHNLPQKWISELKTSEELKEKIEGLKNEIFDSEVFNNFIDEKISSITTSLISYNYASNEEISLKLSEILDFVAEDLLQDESIKKSLDDIITDNIANIIFNYRQEIAALISDTVKEWPIEDMVLKLETEVGGDLQYIRINGTVIGGIAGLVIHFISLFLK
jgi:uncharacterized membrane-anchored protein YjiN (DUF445 family)